MQGSNRRLPAHRARAKTRRNCGDGTISDDRADEEADELRAQLAQERTARAAAERELAELQAHKRHLESRAIGARQTLAYGLGRALIEARTPKGLVGLPNRLRRLWLRQKAKRKERVPDTVPSDIANRMQLADQALAMAAEDGLDAALEWLIQRPDGAAKARVLTELAILAAADDPAKAGETGLRAAEIAPEESRLLAAMAALEAAGAIVAPARIGRLIASAQPLSEPQRTWIARLESDRARLEGQSGQGRLHQRPRTMTAPIRSVVIVTSERWRSSPRAVAAAEAANKAGLAVEYEFSTEADQASLAHIIADSLDFADAAIDRAQAVSMPVLLDLANPPAALAANPESEAGRAAAIRLYALAQAANRFVVRAPEFAKLLEQDGLDAGLVSDEWPLSNKPETAEIETVRMEFGIAADERVVCAIGSLYEGDGWQKLIEDFAALAEAGDADRLAVMGRGPDGPWLAGQADARGIGDRLLFLGLPLFERWPALFAACEAIVFPSGREEVLGSEPPMGMPLAKALGIPMVMSETAWASRTSDAFARPDHNEDWCVALRGLIGTRNETLDPPLGEVLQRIYAGLRDG